MPDITMCKDDSCPTRETCIRFMAKPSERQSYFAQSPRERYIHVADLGCGFYWPREEK